ncbi:signal peptide peptidase SppA [Dehalobacter sp. DCM]|uniref:signal peptide peptidase SppA n=1 Tax=Dehalobacter sp. DCM TaxID=2907827 RepID=UPI003081DB90|nr:signal peptide peptidase SppA [Dehalobacter sp. DCM]
MNKKRWISLAVILVLLIVYIRTDVMAGAKRAGLWSESLNPLASQPSFTTETYQAGIGQTIAILNVNGTIQDTGDTLTGTNSYNHQLFLMELEDAFQNPDIKAIILAVNSPGGGVYESDQIYQKIKSLKESYEKPLVVAMGSMAASGGYYISMPADKIIANRYTMTGSIGVILSTYNYSELAEKVGIEEIIFKSGKNKDIMNPMRDMTSEQIQIMQAMINEYYGYFVDIVAEGRHMDRKTVIGIADGRVYTATQAKSLGLIDSIGDLDNAISEAAKMINETSPTVIQYKNEEGFNFERLIYQAMPLNMTGVIEELQNKAVPTAMYLYR